MEPDQHESEQKRYKIVVGTIRSPRAFRGLSGSDQPRRGGRGVAQLVLVHFSQDRLAPVGQMRRRQAKV